jgi:hypothetical protein
VKLLVITSDEKQIVGEYRVGTSFRSGVSKASKQSSKPLDQCGFETNPEARQGNRKAKWL